MDPPAPRRRLSISLRGSSLPTPTNPSLSATPLPSSLVALIASLPLPSTSPAPSTLASAILRACLLPDADVHVHHLFTYHGIIADSAKCAEILAFAKKTMASPADAHIGDELSDWNQHAAIFFGAAAVAAGSARYVTHKERNVDIGKAAHSADSGNVAGSSKGGGFSASWLRNRVSRLAIVESGGGLSAAEMALSVVSLLSDLGKTDEEIQGDLFDAFAGDFEAVVEVLGRREELVGGHDQVVRDCTDAIDGLESGGGGTGGGIGGRKRRGRRGTEDDGNGEFAVGGGLGGNVFKERERHFPGVQVEGDSVIGAVDRVGLPKGSTREVGKGYEEIFVPPPVGKGLGAGQRMVDVREAFGEHVELLDAMKGVERLNRLQSAVFPMAFGSDENLLVCAPTGAGKTNVALLTVFREILAVKKRMQRSFKVVYVAPMKALAAEVTEKFGKRLQGLGLRVREFTGDMSLSRVEALETHVLVTTPEKWDVVTRKSGSELGDAVTLFIVDEIHLLHDDRGAVLESIVARTLRLSETAQRQIRLVGLSATLPNYADVGAFMRVNPEKGLFHFDGSHRPVPLSQTFIGISEGGQSNSGEARRRRQNKMHEMAWKKVKDSLQRGHQAMIFVHSRKGTAMAAREMLSRAAQDAIEDIFLGSESQTKGVKSGRVVGGEDASAVMPSWAAKEISKSKTSDIRELCSRGVGIHNAGLPRPDRKLVEKLFGEGVIRLLCCTATLAWGINLPARTVVIMGTEVYDAQKGGFVQLGMLDVMQIFGRAGRPQFDTEGEGTIITAHEHLSKYLNLLTSSIPIESQLGSSASRLADHLNAEIVSGTVSSIGEGVRWLSYTYLSVRMPLNPLVYGIDRAEVEADSGLHSRRATLIEQASKALDDARMCRYDPRTGVLAPTDLGRVSSHFYVSHETIVLWNERFRDLSMGPAITDFDWELVYAEVLHAVSCATEFEQMRSRQEEADELDTLTREACPIPLKSGSETREGKVVILLQAHISRAHIRMSDLSYVVQSSTRLLRALFEVALRKGFPSMSLASLELARASESRIWPFQHPLWQFTYSTRKVSGLLINPETVSTIEGSGKKGQLESLKTMKRDDLSSLIRAPKMALTVIRAVNAVPTLEIVSAKVAPLNHTVLQVEVSLFPNFRWNEGAHGNAQSWWMWLEDREEDRVYHSQRLLLTKRQVRSMNDDQSSGLSRATKLTLDFSFSVPVFDPPSSQYWIRVESEQWHTGGGSIAVLTMSDMKLPDEESGFSQLADLRPLPIDAALPEKEARIFQGEMSHFKPLHTQAFHTSRRTNDNVLVSAPAGSGKWIIAELAILQALQAKPGSTVVCVLPDRKSLALREKRWLKLKAFVCGALEVLDSRFVSGGPSPFQNVKVLLTTPEAWDHFSRTWKDESIAERVSLFVFDELHLLSSKKHSEMELVISRVRNIINKMSARKMQFPRIVGLCEKIPNAGEFADWLGVIRQRGLFNFDQSVRQVQRESQVIGVAGDRYTSRMHSMSRTLFSMIQRYSAKKPVLIFVSSKRQSLVTAQDLIRLASVEGKINAFLGSRGNSDGPTVKALRDLSDNALQRCVGNGVGLYHESMTSREREAVERLYCSGYIQIMVATFTLSRSFSVPSHLVVVKGTESYQPKGRRYEDIPVSDILHMIGQAGRPTLDSVCYSIVFVHEPKKNLFKKLLHDSLPIESSLHQDTTNLLLRQIALGRVRSVRDAVEFLTWTFMFQRLKTNPGYYGLKMRKDKKGAKPPNAEIAYGDARKWCLERVLSSFQQLLGASCVSTCSDFEIQATMLGQLCVAYDFSFHHIEGFLEKLIRCTSFEDIISAVGSMDFIAELVDGYEDDTAWSRMAETIGDHFCKAGFFPSKEVAAKKLGIVQCNESAEKRSRVACYSLFIDGSVRINQLGVDRAELYRKVEMSIAAGFETAAEIGKLSLAAKLIGVSQALYQGILPTDDVWARCGYSKEVVSSRGREAGYKTIMDVREDEREFNAFLAKHCENAAQRSGITRWLARRPVLIVNAKKDLTHETQVLVHVEVKRATSLSNEGVEAHSRLTDRRNGGFVVMVGNVSTDTLFGVRRVSDNGHTSATYKVAVDIGSLVVEGNNLQVWVVSDVEMQIMAKAIVDCVNN